MKDWMWFLHIFDLDPYPGLDAVTLGISNQTLWNYTCTLKNNYSIPGIILVQIGSYRMK